MFHSCSELFVTEHCLPLTDEVTVVLVLKRLQHLHLLALHLEILGNIPHLLNGLVYLRRICDFRGDSRSYPRIAMTNITGGNTVKIYRRC